MNITPQLKSWLSKHHRVSPSITDDAIWRSAATDAMFVTPEGEDGHLSQAKLADLTDDKAAAGASRLGKTLNRIEQRLGGPNPDDLFSDGAEGGGSVAIGKRSYSSAKSVATHSKFGTPVRDEFGRPSMTRSDLDNARSGAYLKFLARRSGLDVSWRDEDAALLDECWKSQWVGTHGGEYRDMHNSVSGLEVRALLDDAPSGGVEINPVWFDSDVVQTLLLTGELSPLVDLRPMSRGRRVEGSSMGSPSVQWDHYEGMAANLFDTDSLVSALDTSTFSVVAAVEVGKEILSDSPSQIGSQLVEAISQRMAAELDKVIAVGDGSTQVEGLFSASGLTTINSDNGAAGPPTLDDYESLLFSTGKQFRSAAMRPVFVSSDTSFQRRNAIRVDVASPSTDQRPVFGLDVNNYSTLGWRHVVQNDIPNGSVAFGAMSKFRLYRRQGITIEWFREGQTLAIKNTVLLIVRARYGGRIVDSNAWSKWVDGQT